MIRIYKGYTKYHYDLRIGKIEYKVYKYSGEVLYLHFGEQLVEEFIGFSNVIKYILNDNRRATI